jgi:hypothetical protein
MFAKILVFLKVFAKNVCNTGVNERGSWKTFTVFCKTLKSFRENRKNLVIFAKKCVFDFARKEISHFRGNE